MKKLRVLNMYFVGANANDRTYRMSVTVIISNVEEAGLYRIARAIFDIATRIAHLSHELSHSRSQPIQSRRQALGRELWQEDSNISDRRLGIPRRMLKRSVEQPQLTSGEQKRRFDPR